ncbi:MAG: class I SAM-dependent methyltransferase [Pirellulales bacterium]
MSNVPYTEGFFQFHDQGARTSAAATVPLVLQFVAPTSVVDVGCGTGTWLAQFKAAGISDYLGIDGDYVERRLLAIEPDRFLGRDLAQPLEVGRRFDLALCLEVAEHVPPASAGTLIGSLARLAPLVLFSAAIPHQQGDGHVNEQWPDYWRDQFAAYGYVAVDVLRDRLWQNKDVEPWYRQNLLFFVERARLADYPLLRAEFERVGDPPCLSRVHPDHYTILFDAFSKRLSETERLWIKAALKLRGINLLVFPDWRQPEGVVLGELRALLAAASAHPEHGRLCIVIDLGPDERSLGTRLTSQAFREVLAPNGILLPAAPSVSCVGGPRFKALEWEVLLAVAQGRVILPAEDSRAVATVKAGRLPAITLAALEQRQPLNFQPLA